MIIKLTIDVGLHDVYSAIDVDFARESAKTDRLHPPSEFGPCVTKSPNGFSPPSRISTLLYYTCMITPRILPGDCVSSSKSVDLKAAGL